jgi:predicted DsbA family dithiol-disulfide isomerase
MPPALDVTIFTDPSCPFGFNAQRQHAQLLWHYGHAIDVTLRMIVLSDRSISFEERGIRPEVLERVRLRLRDQYGMPMEVTVPERIVGTLEASRAYVGARLNEPERALGLLRALRRRAFANEPIDELAGVHAAGADAGIGSDTIDAWLADDGVAAELADDMAAARAPAPEALALRHRLANVGGTTRYTAGSATFARDGRVVASPGFQPFETYEVAMASLAPEVERRAAPENVQEVLDWAPYSLATAEVAELRGVPIETAREELRAAGARFTPVANDGYWSAA